MEEQLEYSILIESLNLKNFRCFGDLDINFDEKLTVFIAVNGGGKTTILDAIAEGLKAYLATLKIKGYEKSSLLKKDIKTGLPVSNIAIETELSYVFPLDNVETNEESRDSRTDKETKFKISISEDDSEFSKNNSSFEQYFAKYFKSYFKDTNIPVLAYYGGVDVDTDYKTKNKVKNRLEYVYKEALSASRNNFTAFYDWFEKRYRLYLQAKVDDPTLEMQDIEPELFKIKNAVEIILNDDINDKTYKDLKIRYDAYEEPKIVLGKQNEEKKYDYFEISQFSAGEQALFAFVSDLGLRLIHATPLKKSSQGIKYVVDDDKVGVINGKGIVLIDEVDLHLHPKWQDKVVDKLMQIFPDVQFIMTTHSPFAVAQTHFSQKVYNLNNGVATLLTYAGGHSSDYILSELMDIDPKNQEVEEYIALIRQG